MPTFSWLKNIPINLRNTFRNTPTRELLYLAAQAFFTLAIDKIIIGTPRHADYRRYGGDLVEIGRLAGVYITHN